MSTLDSINAEELSNEGIRTDKARPPSWAPFGSGNEIKMCVLPLFDVEDRDDTGKDRGLAKHCRLFFNVAETLQMYFSRRAAERSIPTSWRAGENLSLRVFTVTGAETVHGPNAV